MTLTLSVTPEGQLVHRPHAYERHTKCKIDHCMICDGGLAVCTRCGGLEGALLDNCPGVKLTAEQHEWNYQKFLKMTAKQMRMIPGSAY